MATAEQDKILELLDTPGTATDTLPERETTHQRAAAPADASGAAVPSAILQAVPPQQSEFQVMFPTPIKVKLYQSGQPAEQQPEEVSIVPMNWDMLCELGIQLAMYGVNFGQFNIFNPQIIMMMMARYKEGATNIIALSIESTNPDGWEKAWLNRVPLVKRLHPRSALEVLLATVKQNYDFLSQAESLVTQYFPQEMASYKQRKEAEEKAATAAMEAAAKLDGGMTTTEEVTAATTGEMSA